MTLLHISGICALAAASLLLALICIKRRLPTLEDIGPVCAVFAGAFAFPIGLHLCSFILPIAHGPEWAAITALPDLYLLNLALGGLVSCVANGVAIAKLFHAQLDRQQRADAKPSNALRKRHGK